MFIEPPSANLAKRSCQAGFLYNATADSGTSWCRDATLSKWARHKIMGLSNKIFVLLSLLKSNSAHTNNYSLGSLGHPAGQCSELYSKKGHLHGFFFNSHSMMTFNKSSYAHCSQVNQFWLGALPSSFSVCARIPHGQSNLCFT